MRKKQTRILLLEDNLADAGFLREALDELEELHQGNAWLSPYELCDAETLEEALLLLRDISFDVILADLWVPDSSGLATFHRLKAAAPHAPLIILLNANDPAFTVRLLQQGAQDILIKHEVDCAPLGRAIRCAMERNRIATGLRRMSVRDELTGLMNFTGFVQLGEPFCRLLHKRGGASVPASCAFFQISNLDAVSELAGRHEEEWLLVELGELLRDFATEVDLVAYLGGGRFAILSPTRSGAALHAALSALASQISSKALNRGTPIELQIQISTAEPGPSNNWQLAPLLDEVEQALWDNKPFEQSCEADSPVMIQ